MKLFSCAFYTLSALLIAGTLPTTAQSARQVAATARVYGQVEAAATAPVKGHIPLWATAANDRGAISPVRQLSDLHLVLSRSASVETAFEQLLADQQNPASPRYHQWLTPQQNAEQYGIAAGDLQAVTNWLSAKGLHVDNVTAGGLFITFSGPAGVVESAFATSLHNFAQGSADRFAPTTEPSVPASLAGVILAVGGLSEQMAHVQSNQRSLPNGGAVQLNDGGSAHPNYTGASGAVHYLAPGDFNTIYDINPIHSAGYTGSGVRVATLIDSKISPADITGFNTAFGLSVAQPNQIVVPGQSDPGIKGSSEGEANLDVQRILGTAPGVTVDLLVMNNLSFANIYSALQYELGTLNDPIVNMSFGSCNSGSSSAAATFDSYFKTGAAQGISFFVSSGDNAAADCDAGSTTIPSAQVLATNLICASSYVTCVGGTQFAEGSGSYWNSSNDTGRGSATGYIPEGAWNEPVNNSGGNNTYQAAGTGGGITSFPKPSWQTGAGVPSDGVRDVPDISFSASLHDGYLVCQGDIGNVCSTGQFLSITYGTSASAPGMAGIAAMLDQRLGARQGNLNPRLYSLAATTPTVFHDATPATSGVTNCDVATPSMCNNSTPAANSLTGGLAGYSLTTGYDLATGLGSLDVANFLTAASTSTTTGLPAFSLTPSSASITFKAGAATGNTNTIQLTSLNSFAGTVVLSCSLSNGTSTSQPACSINPSSVTLASNGTATAVITLGTSTTTTATTEQHASGVLPGVALASFALLIPFRRRRIIRPLLALLLLAASMSAVTGCGKGGTLASTIPTTTGSGSASTYTVTITGTSGSTTAKTTFTLIAN